jgi:hypothetical protein
VEENTFVLGSKSSVAASAVPVGSFPPAINTLPLFRRVAVSEERGVRILPVREKLAFWPEEPDLGVLEPVAAPPPPQPVRTLKSQNRNMSNIKDFMLLTPIFHSLPLVPNEGAGG